MKRGVLLLVAMIAVNVLADLLIFQHVHAQTLIEPQSAYTTADPVRSGAIGLATYSGRWAVSKGDNCDRTNIGPGQNVELWMVEGFSGFGIIAPTTVDGTVDMDNSCDVRFEQLADPTPCFVNTTGACDVALEQED